MSDSTLYVHRRWGEEFLRFLAKRLPGANLDALTVPIVDEFVQPRIRSAGRGTQSQVIQVVRGVLRHLQRSGRLTHDWSSLIQGPRRYRLAAVPTTISLDDVRRLLAGINRRSPIGRRNYAMLLLLAVYGLRAHEVVELRLDDINWRARILHVRQSKTAQTLMLPLTADVGQALVTYLRRGRPHTSAREIFVRHDGKPVAFRKSSAVYAVVRQAFDQAQIHSGRRGPHVLRHTLATQLVQRGFALKVIGDLLGHQHPDSTLLYAKLAVDDLREVALEVPEFRP